MINTKMENLQKFIKKDCFIEKVTAPIGKEYYWLFDFRKLFLNPQTLEMAVDIFWHHFEKEYPFQVGGQELASVPFIAAIVLRSQQIGKPVNGFIIRKSRKTTGLQNIIEGNINEEKIILVDDLIKDGKTLMHQIKVLEEFEKKAQYFFAFINFRKNENKELAQKNGIKLLYLFTLKDFGLKLWDKEEMPPEQNFNLLWRFNSPNPSYYYLLPKSTPCLDEKKIYFGSDNKYFWALNQKDGSFAWKFEIGYSHLKKGIFSSPVLHKNLLYFGAYDGNVYALNKETGKLKWKNLDADYIGSSPAIASDLNLLFIGMEYGLWNKKGGLSALNLENGKNAWSYRMKNFVHSTPAYCQEKKVVAVGCNDGYVYIFNAKNGNLKWKFKTNAPVKASFCFSLKRNLIFFGSFDKTLYALDIDSGKIKGEFKSRDLIYSTPLIDGDDMFFSSLDKNLYSINLETGELNWCFKAGGRFFSSPKIIGDKIYIGSTDGRMYEISRKTGRCLSYFQTTERIMNNICLDAEGDKLFIMTYANEIYCLNKIKAGT